MILKIHLNTLFWIFTNPASKFTVVRSSNYLFTVFMKTGPAARLLTQVFSILLQLPLSVFNMICYNCHKSQFFIPYLLTPNQCPLNRHQCLLFGNAFHLLRVDILVIFNILHDICNAKYNSKLFVCKNYTIFVLTICFTYWFTILYQTYYIIVNLYRTRFVGLDA